MASCNAKVFAFHRVYVYVTPVGHTIIQWELNSKFTFQDAYPVFYVEWARSAGEWTRLNPDNPVENLCLYVDENKYNCGMAQDLYYRVVAVTSGGTEYFSKPEPALGELGRHDWLISRDAVRKEYLRLKKYVGTSGHLLRRREHGIPCTECTDWDTEDVINSSCPICYGTGFIGGFYNAIPFYVDTGGTTSNKDVVQPLGTVDNKNRTFRAVAYPWIETYDMWVQASTNIRFIFRVVQQAVAIRSVPIVYTVRMHQLPQSDIKYRVPFVQDLSSYYPSDETPPTPGGWRGGITFDEGW